jgi:hypothetical protein
MCEINEKISNEKALTEIYTTFPCPTHSCRNDRNPLESTGMRLESTGIAIFLQEWYWIPQEWYWIPQESTGMG